MKQLSIFFLTMFMSMVGAKSFAHDIAVANDDGVTIYYVWTNNNTEVAVSYRGSYSSDYENEYTGNVVIPESVVYNGKTYSVTRIAPSAFEYCSSLTSVTIPNCVTSIGNYAFHGCGGRGLTSIEIPNSVTSLGWGAFQGCSWITSIEIPDSVTSIGGYAFYECSRLTSITIPNSVTTIGHNAFYRTAWYNNQPDGLIYAGKVAFKYKGTMPANTNIKIKEGTLGIAGSAFCDCSGLTSIEIPQSVTSIGESAFYDCSGLTSIEIPNSVTSIEEETFYNCSGLTSIEIPNSVTSIGYRAFFNCSGLTSVTIPNSVTSIGRYAFYGCSGLKSVNIGNGVISISAGDFDGTGWYNNQADGLLYLSNWLLGYKGDKPSGALNITDGTRGIANYAFSGCSGLTSVTIPNSVTSIGSSAFNGCSGLTSVTIPNSVTSIGMNAFYNCSGLTSVTIGNSVTSIGQYAFCGCSGLTAVAIPNSVTTIGDGAFYNCSGLTSVTIPNSVTSIGSSTFDGCSGLTSVTVLISTPLEIGYYTFSNRNNATLYVPAGSLSAYQNADYWKGFKEIIELGEFGSPITFVNQNVMQLCVDNWDTDGSGWLSYMEAAAVTNLGEVFADNANITSFDELQYFTGLTTIGENAFMGCSSLASVTLPEGIVSIGDYAFASCKALTTFTIPANVSEIGSNAFRACTGLTDVYCLPEDVPTTASNAFNNSNISNATLHVVVSSYDAYKAVVPWKNFKNMLGDIPVPCVTPVISYVEGKLVFTCETDGAIMNAMVSCEDAGEYASVKELDLSVTYQISVYATKEGYTPSETATATLCWIDTEPVDGVATGTMEIPAVPVLVKSRNGVITVEGLGNGTQVSVYTTDGVLVGQGTSADRIATVCTSLISGTIAIVNMGKKAVKIVMR